MPTLDLSPDELLTTTRAVRRRLDLDRPVELELIRACLQIGLQAPTASNAQDWQFVLVTDQGQREALAAIYRKAFAAYRNIPVSVFALAEKEVGEHRARMERIADSASYLAEQMHRVPALLIPCIKGRFELPIWGMTTVMQATAYGSILPATWNFMLAARARGLGTCLTTVHLMHEEETAELLGIPHQAYTQIGLIPIAHTLGTDFKPGARRDLDQVLHIDDW